MSELGYAGDIPAQEAWDRLKADTTIPFIDVRSEPEFEFEGVVDVTELGIECHEITFQQWPGMVENPDFVDEIAEVAPDKDKTVILLCRNGGRSALAAAKLTEAGYREVFNVRDGLFGELDDDQHRGNLNGWAAEGLPWEQY